MNSRRLPLVSIVVPCRNEEQAFPILFKQLESVFTEDNPKVAFEFVFVNDGSTDETAQILNEACSRSPRYRAVHLSRNFGKEAALTAGLFYAKGDAVVPIDADLQDPPELVLSMVEKWQAGWEVVLAQRSSRASDSWLKRTTSEFFYKWFNKVSSQRIPFNTGDFRLMDRKVVDAIMQFPERNRFMKGIFAAAGFRQTNVQYQRPPRSAGQTKWNYWKLWNFAIDGITAFSTLPLRLWTYVGATISLLALSYATILVAKALIFGRDVPGYASLMVAILGLGGVQLISLGIIGEYLGRTYLEAKRRPQFIISGVVNGFTVDSVPKSSAHGNVARV